MERQKVALIVGAGWSAAAGYPLARDLIRGPIYAATETSRMRAQAVLDSFGVWSTSRADAAAEVFLADVLGGDVQRPPTEESPTLFDPVGGSALPWAWAVEAVTLRLAFPVVVDRGDPRSDQALVYPKRHANRLRYSANLSVGASSPRHTSFIRDVLGRHELTGVVTTNYDTLVERVLRHRAMRRGPEPGFYYGGLPRPQQARGHFLWDRFDPHYAGVPGTLKLTGRMAVYKLHGSLNWERGGERIVFFRDQRLVYRHGGTAAIIPPSAEKQAESWLSSIWKSAEAELARSDRWIVVGYSLPPYDHAIRALLRRAADVGNVRSIDLHDPFARELAVRWSEATSLPVNANPGL